uniref:Signal peptidase complex subunit 3 n=1 Tax=Tetraselmis sp. GSL018 TaxID=582737 RepID=A0A061R218_9CHLO
MHSVLVRANALLTFAGTTLSFMALGAMFTDFFHKSSPEVAMSIKSVERLYNTPSGNDEAYVVMDLQADLRSVFSWNTKQLFLFINVEYETNKNQLNQVVVFDKIVQTRESAVISNKKLRNKYNLVDQGRNLRGRQVNLTVTWQVMPIVGALYTQSQTFQATLPKEYVVSKGFRY